MRRDRDTVWNLWMTKKMELSFRKLVDDKMEMTMILWVMQR